MSHTAPIPLINTQPLILHPPKPPKQKRTRHHRHRYHSLKNQRLRHRKWRIRPLPRLQPITNNNKQPPQQLPPRPTNRTRRLRPHRPRNLNKPFQRHRHEAETRCSQNSEDDEWSDERAGTGRPDESEVGSCDDRDEDAYEGEVGFCAVDDGGGDCCGDEADEDEDGACDAGF